MASNNGNNTPQKVRYCSFCGRRENQVNFLIPSPTGIYICDLCVDTCQELIYENTIAIDDVENLSMTSLPKPIEIKKSLDQYVIGQDEAKVALSVAVYNHYKRLIYNEKKARAIFFIPFQSPKAYFPLVSS